MRALVLGVRLLLELVLLVVLGWTGLRLAGGPAGVAIAMMLPLGAALVWGMVVSPKARLGLPSSVRVVVELALFALAGTALAWLTRPAFGVALVVADLAVIAALAWTSRGNGGGLSPHDAQQPTGSR
jgi:hypothetical protein